MRVLHPGIAAAAVIMFLVGCSATPDATQKPEPVEVAVVTIRQEPVTVMTELTGRINPTAVSQVRPQVDGVIKARLFQEGSYVRAGQPLYQIDARLYSAARDQASAQLASAEAAVATADAKVSRYRRLTDTDAISRQDVDDAIAAARQGSASVRLARATLQTASVNLGFTRVLAPISGRIGRSAFTQGALVTASQADPLATIQQIDPIYVDIQQSGDALLNLREQLAQKNVLPASADVKLVLSNGRIYPQTGKVEFGEVSVDPDSGMVTLRARFPNPQGTLLPGMFVRVQTPQATVLNGILVPQQGITRDPAGKATALVVTADNKIAKREVVTGQAVKDKWLVTSGLKAGDRLVVEGVAKVKAGDTVKPVAMPGTR